MPITKIVNNEKFYIANTPREKELFEYIKTSRSLDDICNFLVSGEQITGEILNENYESPVLVAVKNNKLDIVELLLNFFFESNILAPNQPTPLLVAAQNGYEQMVEKLLKNIQKVDKHHPNEETPLFTAIKQGHLNIVKMLLNKGADLNAQDFPMKELVEQGNIKTIEYFKDLFKNDTTCANKLYDISLINIALDNNKFDMVKFLTKAFVIRFQQGLLVDKILDSNLIENPEYKEFILGAKDNYELLNALFSKSVDQINPVEKRALNSLLNFIMKNGTEKSIKDLLHIAQNNTKPYSKEQVLENNEGLTQAIDTKLKDGSLLSIAAGRAGSKNEKIVKHLLKYGSTVTSKAYLEAAKQGNLKACKLLNKLGEISDESRKEGWNSYKEYLSGISLRQTVVSAKQAMASKLCLEQTYKLPLEQIVSVENEAFFQNNSTEAFLLGSTDFDNPYNS